MQTVFPFFALEGVTGVGKAVVGRALAERLDFLYLETPGEELVALRDKVDRTMSLATRLRYYILADYFASERIGALRARQGVVLNKYIFTTVAHHELLLNRNLETYVTADLLQPDFTILLTAESEVIHQRLYERSGTADKYDALDHLMSAQHRLIMRLRRNKNTLIVDTSKSVGEETVDTILHGIEQMTKGV